MAKNLIIVESPKKIQSYKKVLGEDYNVMASVGHCVDLPVKSLGIDIRKKFSPTFEVKDDHADVVQSLKTAARRAKHIYLMSDEDREGEAIAWHLCNEIRDVTKAEIHRATTNEITAKGIRRALDNPGDLDMRKIDAYLCRRMLDRLCGYKTSYLTYQATGGRSAGRVQSVILRIIAERELEIVNFKPEEYWVLTAYFISSKGDPYTGVLSDKIKVPNGKLATEIYDQVMAGTPVVTSVESKEVNVNPYSPLTTALMVQSSSSILGWGAKRTMQVAQGLYENGHITYMRTDSPFMASEAIDAIRTLVRSQHGCKYVPSSPRVYRSKKGAQEAHECCRPTCFDTPPQIFGDEQKLYDLIWKRAVSSQMTPGLDERTKVITKVSNYDFITNGNVVLFDGFRKVWNYGKSKDVEIPKLSKKEKVTLKALEKEQKFTSPPPRFTDGSLNKQCEKEQIARPATFANFIEILKQRNYISQKGKSFQATELGLGVTDFLKKASMCFVDIKFTAGMEHLLDSIQDGKKELGDVMSEFWTRLKEDIDRGKKVKSEAAVTKYKCPKCKGSLLSKHSRFGPFYACENYKPSKKVKGKKVFPEGSCQYTAQIGAGGEPMEKKPAAKKEYASFNCKKCGAGMVKRKSQHGEFFGCEKYPTCKTVASLEGVFQDGKKRKRRRKAAV